MAKVFGVTSTGGYGVLQSVTKNSTAELAEARDEDGKVTDQIAYSRTQENSFEGVFQSTDSVGAAGDSLLVAETTGLITTLSENESNTDYKRVSGTIQLKDAATQVAYTS